MPYLRALNMEVGEIVNFAVLSGVDVLYVARMAPRGILTMSLDGFAASGKCHLAGSGYLGLEA